MEKTRSCQWLGLGENATVTLYHYRSDRHNNVELHTHTTGHVVVQSLSRVWLCDALDCQAPLSSTTSQSLIRFVSVESVMLSNHLSLCRPLLLYSSIFHSISVFSKESALPIGWPKYWSFSNSPSNKYSALISFRIDWFDLLAVQGTLKSLLQPQFKSIYSSVFSFPYGPILNSYMTTGKTSQS